MQTPLVPIILFQLLQLLSAKPFWLSAKIDSIQWKDGCLTTALCSQPRFQIIKDLLPISERVLINWPVAETTNAKTMQPFVSYFPTGRVEDVSISAQVIGVDTTYSFPRICDQTPAIRVFPEDMAKIFMDDVEKDELNKTIEIKGKCFDVTITITKHLERCPWCPNPSDVLVTNEIPKSPEALASKFHNLFETIYPFGASTQENLQIALILLSTFAVLISIAFSIILAIYLRARNKKKDPKNVSINVQPKLIPFSKSEYDSGYNIPWDSSSQQKKPLTYWMSNSTKSTLTSPLSTRSDFYSIP